MLLQTPQILQIEKNKPASSPQSLFPIPNKVGTQKEETAKLTKSTKKKCQKYLKISNIFGSSFFLRVLRVLRGYFFCQKCKNFTI
ncbi:MAG: hypothetical protein A2Y62_16490 [Candidatus Fischerbacteria bacterium RBG_13_37_8]|uniref:Uncharacterized protein n=1 Tax=Candidatus Fischerbacteria bacterium RBG_13_37_8 TaxID=1817863 RepID=A0A1F5VJE7_9BACT|nr:MAG: hypothetical protein A2Y62_16490 [Candidatus Fischerbacteria bacterium RBG_13_37_8]